MKKDCRSSAKWSRSIRRLATARNILTCSHVNLKGQAPVLVDGELSLYDSTIILEYLEDAYPYPPLYPSAPPLRARCRQLELYADEVMITPFRALMHRTGPRPPHPEVWIECEANARAAESALSRHLRELNQKLDGNEYLCGALSAADIAIFMSVLFDLRLGGPSLFEGAVCMHVPARPSTCLRGKATAFMN